MKIEIIPLKGAGEVSFGDTKAEVISKLGRPDSEDNEMDLIVGNVSCRWSNPSIEIVFHNGLLLGKIFERQHIYKAMVFTANDPHLSAWDETVVGRSSGWLIDHFSAHGYADLEVDDRGIGVGDFSSIASSSARCKFLLKNDRVLSAVWDADVNALFGRA